MNVKCKPKLSIKRKKEKCFQTKDQKKLFIRLSILSSSVNCYVQWYKLSPEAEQEKNLGQEN